MIRFYSPDIESTLTLGESDSGHAIRVLRLHAGDTIHVVDGKGSVFLCRITDPHPKHAGLEILSREEAVPEWRGRITLAVAPTKNIDRIEWLLEKSVEIGVDRFIPVICSRSERKVVKTDRLERIMVSAMKQSLKATLPELLDATPLAEVARMCGAEQGQKFVGYCSDAVERRALCREYRPGSDVTILVGPEGDFTPDEIDLLLGARFMPVTFGARRLRTETAALYALTTLHVVQNLSSPL